MSTASSGLQLLEIFMEEGIVRELHSWPHKRHLATEVPDLSNLKKLFPRLQVCPSRIPDIQRKLLGSLVQQSKMVAAATVEVVAAAAAATVLRKSSQAPPSLWRAAGLATQ